MEDDKLLKKAKKGDTSAFGEIYGRYAPKIYRYVFLKLGGRRGEAEDLTHEVFLSAWKNIETFDVRGIPFSSYLYRAARNSVIDYWRTRKQTYDIETVPENVFSVESALGEKMDSDSDLKVVKECIGLLEQTYQDVLIMKFVEDLSNKEISAALGKSEGAVRVIQHRALRQLKKAVLEHESRFKETTKEV